LHLEALAATGSDPAQRWRCRFLDEIETPVITDEPWQSAPNYSPDSANGIDHVVLAVRL